MWISSKLQSQHEKTYCQRARTDTTIERVLEESSVRISDNKESPTETMTKEIEVQTEESQTEVGQENTIIIKSLRKKMHS